MNALTTKFDRSLNRNPLGEIKNMQRQMDRLFNRFLNNGSVDFDADIFSSPIFAPSQTNSFAPLCDIDETDTHYLLSFDLPGLKKEDIKMDLRDNMLTVSGERKEEREEDKKGRYRSERYYGSFERSFALPANIKADQVDANYSEGVLRVAVPKAEATQSQQIKIGEGKSSFWDKLTGQKKEDAKKIQAH